MLNVQGIQCTKNDLINAANNVIEVYGVTYVVIPTTPQVEGVVIEIEPYNSNPTVHAISTFNPYIIPEGQIATVNVIKGSTQGFVSEIEMKHEAKEMHS